MTMRRRLSPRIAALACAAALVGVALPVAAAEESPPPGGPRRGEGRRPIPPRAAVEACAGKKEGDPCRFLFREGMLEGVCLSGAEGVFACRPERGGRPPEGRRPPGDGPAAGPVGGSPEGSPPPPPRPEGGSGVAAPAGTQDSSALAGGTPSRPAIGEVRAPARARGLSSLPAAAPPPGTAAPAPAPPAVPPPPGVPPPPSPVPVGALLATALGGALLAWLACSRYSREPLRRLRKVTRELADGNLSARVGEGLVRRDDEVADLARDVDRMAGRIQGLVGAHHRLIRDVSHELRSPLARLGVALELARQSAGPSLSAPFDRIERESARLNELIGQLLMLTRLESDEAGERKDRVDLSALLEEVARDGDFEAARDGRRVVVTATAPLELSGNRELLRQAFENLVRNAARYTAEGSPVEVSLHRLEAGGRARARVEVRDHGPGVPDGELENIFRPFYRVDDARQREGGGAGVGLAIAERAIRLHGGRVKASNAPDGGLVMEVEIPLA